MSPEIINREKLSEIMNTLDLAEFEVLRKSLHAKSKNKRFGRDRLKYLDHGSHFLSIWKIVTLLGFDKKSPRKILDIGSGPGYFGFIVNSLGHDCIGLDRPNYEVFERLCKWVGLQVICHTVTPYQALPLFDKEFDVVTAFGAQFNYFWDERRLFDLGEWNCFLDDLRDNVLRSGGAFYLKMNIQDDQVGARFGDVQLMQLFASRGAQIHRNRLVLFNSLF